MSTTSLFVELIVIGVGAFAWVILFTLTVFGWGWVPVDRIFAPTSIIPLLSIIYVLGIVSDRIADSIFERFWVHHVHKEYFRDTQHYQNVRTEIMLKSERLSELLEYNRSRMRICRGWAFNSFLIALSLNLFLRVRLPLSLWTVRLSLFGTAASLAFGVASWYTWKKLTVTEHKKVKQQGGMLLAAEKKLRESEPLI